MPPELLAPDETETAPEQQQGEETLEQRIARRKAARQQPTTAVTPLADRIAARQAARAKPVYDSAVAAPTHDEDVAPQDPATPIRTIDNKRVPITEPGLQPAPVVFEPPRQRVTNAPSVDAAAAAQAFETATGKKPAQVAEEEGEGPGRAIVTTGQPQGLAVPRSEVERLANAPELKTRIATRLAMLRSASGTTITGPAPTWEDLVGHTVLNGLASAIPGVPDDEDTGRRMEEFAKAGGKLAPWQINMLAGLHSASAVLGTHGMGQAIGAGSEIGTTTGAEAAGARLGVAGSTQPMRAGAEKAIADAARDLEVHPSIVQKAMADAKAAVSARAPQLAAAGTQAVVQGTAGAAMTGAGAAAAGERDPLEIVKAMGKAALVYGGMGGAFSALSAEQQFNAGYKIMKAGLDKSGLREQLAAEKMKRTPDEPGEEYGASGVPAPRTPPGGAAPTAAPGPRNGDNLTPVQQRAVETMFEAQAARAARGEKVPGFGQAPRDEIRPASDIATHDVQTISNAHDLRDLATGLSEREGTDLETAQRRIIARMRDLTTGTGMSMADARKQVDQEFAEKPEVKATSPATSQMGDKSPSEAAPTTSPATSKTPANGTAEREFSSTQLNLPAEHVAAVKQLASKIPDADLAADGREDTPHITVKFGLHTENAEDVRPLLKDQGPITVKLGKTSVFPASESGKADVVKVDVDSPELHALNKTIADALPHTDTHPDYKPHVTVAYVKPGLGKKYAGDASMEGRAVTLNQLTFSDKSGKTVDIPLSGTAKPAAPIPLTAEALERESAAMFDRADDIRKQAVAAGTRAADDTSTDDDGLGVCTNCAQHIVDKFGGAVVGYHVADNPGAKLGQVEEGHDFAVTGNGRFIVDPWAHHTVGETPKSTLDLTKPEDRAEARRLYGDPAKWSPVTAGARGRTALLAVRKQLVEPKPESAPARLQSGRLQGDLSKVKSEDLLAELKRLYDANNADGEQVRPTVVEDTHGDHPEFRPHVSMKRGAMKASGRIAARNKSIEKVTAELKSRGMSDEDILLHGAGNISDEEMERLAMQDGEPEDVPEYFKEAPGSRLIKKPKTAEAPKTKKAPLASTAFDTPKVEEARQWTLDRDQTFSIDTPERHALRQQIADDLYGDGATKKEKQFTYWIGLPASGKSGLAEADAKRSGALLVDTDMAKPRLPEYEGGKGTSLVHLEAVGIRNMVRDRALVAGDNIVLPTVGQNLAGLQAEIDELRKIGYTVHLRFADLPADKAAPRAVQRYHDGGIFVDPAYILSISDLPEATYEGLRHYPGTSTYERYDTDTPRGQPARLTESGENDRGEGRGLLSPAGGPGVARVAGESEARGSEVERGAREEGVDTPPGRIKKPGTKGPSRVGEAPAIHSQPTDSPAFKRWFGESRVVDEKGTPLVVYHGAQRSDRFGPTLFKSRATSGPMPFFTDDPAIASNYAESKADTSIPSDDNNYEAWFRLRVPGLRKPLNLNQAWGHLSSEERARISALAPRVTIDPDVGTDKIILGGPDEKSGIGSYDHEIKMARGNALKALVESWLVSGSLFDEEEKFQQVLSFAGVPLDRVEFHHPYAAAPGVAPVYLSIQRPLITSDIPPTVIAALERAAGRQRGTRIADTRGDGWAKDQVTAADWITELKNDLSKGTNSYAWTRIPDWVTRVLKGLGYDGVHDTGGKGGGKSHSVWVPFEPGQVKSATGNRGTFDRNSSNILREPRGHYDPSQTDLFTRQSPAEREKNVAEEERLAFGTSAKARAVAEAIRRIEGAGIATSKGRIAELRPSKGAKTWVDLRGQQLGAKNGIDQTKLAELLQVYRNPNMELLHYILLNDDGEILSHTAETSGALNWAKIAHPHELIARAKRLGATRAIMAHNHPSGDPTPSADDQAVTMLFGAALQKEGIWLEGHLVIDHGTASWLHLNPAGATAVRDAASGTTVAPSTLNTADITYPADRDSLGTPHSRGALPVHSAEDAAAIVARVIDPKAPLLSTLWLNAQGRLVAIEPRPVESADSIDSWLRAGLKAHAAASAIVVAPQTVAARLARDGGPWSAYVLDVIGTGGSIERPETTSYAAAGRLVVRFPPESDKDSGRRRVFERGPSEADAGGRRDGDDEAGRVSPPDGVAEERDEPTVGVSNAASAAARGRLGMEERVAPEPRTQEEMYAAGKAVADADPQAVTRLIDELRADPERIVGTEAEAGLLLKYRVDLDRKLHELLTARDEAAGNEDRLRVVQMQLDALRQDIREFVELAERTGTATGRALAARRMMSDLDYSLSTMEAMSEAAKGRRLTEAELAEIRKLHESIRDRMALVERDAADARERAAAAESALQHAELLLDAIGPIGAATQGKLDDAAAAAKNRLRARGFRAAAGLDPADLRDHAIIGAAELARGIRRFADWSAKMRGIFGDAITPHLDDVFKASTEKLAAEAVSKPRRQAAPKTPTDITARLKERFEEGVDSLADLRPYLREIALDAIRDGVTGREALLDRVTDEVRAAIGDVTRSEVRDALSGYGTFRPLDHNADRTRLRELQAEMQKLAQLEALTQNERPKATGFERQPPTDEVRRLTKLVNDAKRRAGISGQSDATRLRTALDSTKTRLRNAIRDLEVEIDTGQRTVRGKRTSISDPEIESLRTQLTALRKIEVETFGKPEMSDEDRLALAIKGAARIAETWAKRVGDARQGKFTGVSPRHIGSSPVLDAIRAQSAAAREEYRHLKSLDPAQQAKENERANRAYRAQLARQEADLLDRMARSDYSRPAVRPGMSMDAESLKRRADVERVKQEYNAMNRAFEKANRTPGEKARDRWQAWVRAGMLSWPTVIGKLTAVAATRMVTNPLTDLVAFGVAKALPRLAEGAPRYGTSSARVALAAEAKAHVAFWTDGMRSAAGMLRNVRSNLSVLHDNEKTPAPLHEYLGMLHGALKEPVKQAEYARSLYRRTYEALARGEDTTDPLVQLRLSNEAYLDGNRAISMNDSPFVSRYNRALRSLEEKDKATGKRNPVLVAIQTALKTEMPIVKVPVNIVRETSEIIGGALIGPARAAWSYYNGIEDLKPVERDSIIRLISVGAIGLAMMALGYYKRHDFGGYYQPGEKRKPDDVKAGAVRIGGTTIKPYLLHNPFIWAAQFGATIGRVAESRFRARDEDPQGLGSGVVAAGIGLLREIPFAREIIDDATILDPKQTTAQMEKKAASWMVPGVVQWAAAQGDSIPRKPQGLIQRVENNVPGLRDRVAVDSGKVKAEIRAGIISGAISKDSARSLVRSKIIGGGTAIDALTLNRFSGMTAERQQQIIDRASPERRGELRPYLKPNVIPRIRKPGGG